MKKITLILAALTIACAAPTTHALAPAAVPYADLHWSKLPTVPYKGKQDDIYFVDASLGFYVNGQGKIYRTQDGGQQWQLVLDQPGTYFRAIGMVDSKHGYAGNIGTDYFPGVTDTNPLYETVDGGATWHVVKDLPGAPVKGICAIDILKASFINAGVRDERTIIHAGGRVGSPAYLLRSLDGGNSWTNIDMSPWVAMIVDVKFFDAMNGVVFAGSDADIEKSHALIVVTHDGGQTWTKTYESARPAELTWKGAFPSRQVGYATIQSYAKPASAQRWVAKTTDGGKNWKEIPLVQNAEANEFGVGFLTNDLGWVGTSKGAFETRDGGASWQPVEMGRVINKIRILPEGDSFRAYAIGADVYQFGKAPASTVAADAAPVEVKKP